MPDYYNLFIDPEKHAEQKRQMEELIKSSSSKKDEKPLDLDAFHRLVMAVKLQREKNPNSKLRNLYFPNQESVDQFVSWMDDPKTLLAMEASNG